MNRFEFRKLVEEKYSAVSRFKGTAMNISTSGQHELKSVISKRLTEKNVDKVAELMSSNLCELYFGVLTKFTEGKRLNVDSGDAWRIMQYFVAGMRSDPNFVRNLAAEIGIANTTIAAKKEELRLKRKEYLSTYKQTEKAMFRRKVTKQAKNVLLGRNSRDKCRHEPDKLNIKTTKKKGSKTKGYFPL